MSFSLIGTKKDGKITYSKVLMQQALNALPDGEFEFTLGPVKKKRSNALNAYYWGVVLPIVADYFGFNSNEEAHEAMKIQFLSIPSDGFKLATVKSTTEMTNPEFKDFVAKIQRWMAQDFGVVVPDPRQDSWL